MSLAQKAKKEKEEFIHRKQQADKFWLELHNKVINGIPVDHKMLAHAMDMCNQADYALLVKKIKYD